ncbi:hypothetical protein BJX76DRAFT_239910 [Aspergillus varians]
MVWSGNDRENWERDARYLEGVEGIYNGTMRVTLRSPDAFRITLSLSGVSQSLGGSPPIVPVGWTPRSSCCDTRFRKASNLIKESYDTVSLASAYRQSRGVSGISRFLIIQIIRQDYRIENLPPLCFLDQHGCLEPSISSAPPSSPRLLNFHPPTHSTPPLSRVKSVC